MYQVIGTQNEKETKYTSQSGIKLCMCPANERRRYIVTSSLIGWVHSQNDPWGYNPGTLAYSQQVSATHFKIQHPLMKSTQATNEL